MKTVLVLAILIGVGIYGWMNAERVQKAYDSFAHWVKDSNSNTTASADSADSSNSSGGGGWFSPSKAESPKPVMLSEPYYLLRERISFEADGALRVAQAGSKVRKLGVSGTNYLIEVGGYRTVAAASKLTQNPQDLTPSLAKSNPQNATANAANAANRKSLELEIELLDKQIAQTKDELIKEQKRQDMWKLYHHNDPVNDQTLFLKNLLLRYETEKNQTELKLAGMPPDENT